MRIVLLLLVGALACLCGSAAPAPAPRKEKASARITQKMLRDLVGRDHFSEPLSALRDLLGEPPTATYFTKLDKSFYHNWKAEGLSIQFDADCKVVNSFLYADGHAGYRQYAGELPNELAFGDGPADVRMKLGAPEEASESDTKDTHARWEYPGRGLWLDFSTPRTTDADAKLVMLVVAAPQKER